MYSWWWNTVYILIVQQMNGHISMVTNVCNIGLLVFSSHGKIMCSHFPFKEPLRLSLNSATALTLMLLQQQTWAQMYTSELNDLCLKGLRVSDDTITGLLLTSLCILTFLRLQHLLYLLKSMTCVIIHMYKHIVSSIVFHLIVFLLFFCLSEPHLPTPVSQNASANAGFANFDAFGGTSGSTSGFPSAAQTSFHPSNTGRESSIHKI